MTRPNYNERLDTILARLDSYDRDMSAAKSALTQLFKDLVVDAKPETYEKGESYPYTEGFNHALDGFEQNLLKLLENR